MVLMPPSPATRSVSSFVVFAILLVASVATAAPRVVIVAPPPRQTADGADDLLSLLQAELTAVDLDVVVDNASDDVDAIVMIDREPRAVRVWTAATMRMRTYASDPRRPAGADESLARQVAEVLRAELVIAPSEKKPPKVDPPALLTPFVTPAPPPAVIPPRATPPPPPPAPRPPPPPPSPTARVLGEIAVMPTVTLSPGPLPAMAQLSLSARFHVWRLRPTLLGVFPLDTVDVEDARGVIIAGSGVAGASLGYDLADGPVSVVPNAGVAWQWINTTGRANPPFESNDASDHFAFVFAGVDAGYAFSEWIAVRLGARIGVSQPTPTFAIANETIGTFGQPAVQLSIGVAIPMRVDEL